LRLAQSAPCREFFQEHANAGAHKQEESGEARNRNNNDNDKNYREMQHSRVCPRRHRVPGRMREKSRAAVGIDGIGPVDTSGSRQVTPADSTTYHLIAKGAGGTQEATARVTVNPTAEAPPPTTSNATEEELFRQNVKDIYFDYDKYDIRAAEQGALQGDAQFLQQHPNIHITIEGHCDERGSTEYNLALGTNRADTVKNALIQAGVSGDRIKVFSYGKEKPSCTESNESCWQQNRRGHFVYEK
jgi:peptidoglycan-associated lipoprotein